MALVTDGNKITFKKGAKVLIIKGNNSNSNANGKIVEVLSISGDGQTFIGLLDSGSRLTFYTSNPPDQFELVSKEMMINHLEKLLAEKNEEAKKIENKLDFHRKFETHEDYIAFKIDEILKTHNESKEEDKKPAIAALLKEFVTEEMF